MLNPYYPMPLLDSSSGSVGRPSSSKAVYNYKVSPDLKDRWVSVREALGVSRGVWEAIVDFFRSVLSFDQNNGEATDEAVLLCLENLPEPCKAQLAEVGKKAEDMLAALNDPKIFEEKALELRNSCDRLGADYAGDLPDGFSTQGFLKAVIKGYVNQMDASLARRFCEMEDDKWAAYESLGIGMIFGALQGRVDELYSDPIQKEALKLQLQERQECCFSRFFSEAAVGGSSELGSGAMNTVSKMGFNLSTVALADSPSVESPKLYYQAVKPIEHQFSSKPELHHIPTLLGQLPAEDPGIVRRNIATTHLADALQLNVVAKATGGMVPPSNEGAPPLPAVIMQLCAKDDGIAAVSSYNSILTGKADAPMNKEALHKDPRFLEDYSNLVVLDYLSGQCDRHSGNILLLFKEETDESTGEKKTVYAGMKAIDHDVSFGKRRTPISSSIFGEDAIWSAHYFRMPANIDRSLANRLLALDTAEKCEAFCEAFGGNLLTAEEKSAFRFRLDDLITVLQRSQKTPPEPSPITIIEDKKWSDYAAIPGNLLRGGLKSHEPRDWPVFPTDDLHSPPVLSLQGMRQGKFLKSQWTFR